MSASTSGDPSPATRLALGTAQFGLNYGIANLHGQLGRAQGAAVLAEARSQKMDTLDTATLYGESERQLGLIGVDAWRIVSKLPGIPPGCADVRGWVFQEVRASLTRLKVGRLSGLLLHRPAELLQPQGSALYAALLALKEEKLVTKIGVSIYGPDELPVILANYPIDLVQAPLNVFDRRLVQSGWLDRLTSSGIEVHARSVFLQGLLLMPNRPERFAPWESLWRRWDAWLAESKLQPLDVCLKFALSFPQIAKVVVGVDSAEQLRQIIAAAKAGPVAWPEDVWTDDCLLLHPNLWPKT